MSPDDFVRLSQELVDSADSVVAASGGGVAAAFRRFETANDRVVETREAKAATEAALNRTPSWRFATAARLRIQHTAATEAFLDACADQELAYARVSRLLRYQAAEPTGRASQLTEIEALITRLESRRAGQRDVPDRTTRVDGRPPTSEPWEPGR